MIHPLKSSGYGIAFGIFSVVVAKFAAAHPSWTEKYYSRGMYPVLRWIFDHTVGFSPIAGFYLFWIAVIAYWVLAIRAKAPYQRFLQKTGYWTVKILGFTGVLIGLFYWSWGYNYARLDVAKQLHLEPMALDSAELWEALHIETAALTTLRAKMTSDTLPLNAGIHQPAELQTLLHIAVQDWLKQNGYPSTGRVPLRKLKPKGILLSFQTMGIYWPFAGESNVDAGLHPLRMTSVIPHELAHGYGFGDEGICNFIAYVSCVDHPHPYIAYAARLSHWQDLANECMQYNTDVYLRDYKPFIPAGIRQDVRAIAAFHQQYPSLFSGTRQVVYDQYLKSQGIASGMLNYDEVLMLVQAWRKQHNQNKG